MPRSSADLKRPSISPGPPPQASSASPPQNTNFPSCLKAWREYIGAKRMPFERIHNSVSWLKVMSCSAMSGFDL